MSRGVLILAACYDASTLYTYDWAKALHERLLRQRVVAVMLRAETVCHASAALQDCIDRSEHVVFLGHGARDSWTGLPQGQATASRAVIDTTRTAVLSGRKAYANCCHSFVGFSLAHNDDYVGYDDEFSFEAKNHEKFRDVVVNSVVDYVTGSSAVVVAKNLQTLWDRLKTDFLPGGQYARLPNSTVAAWHADMNAQRVQGK